MEFLQPFDHFTLIHSEKLLKSVYIPDSDILRDIYPSHQRISREESHERESQETLVKKIKKWSYFTYINMFVCILKWSNNYYQMFLGFPPQKENQLPQKQPKNHLKDNDTIFHPIPLHLDNKTTNPQSKRIPFQKQNNNTHQRLMTLASS